MTLSGVRVVPLCDGYAALPLSQELLGQQAEWAAERTAFPWAFEGEAHWTWHVHAFLLRTADGPVLIDAGIGALGRPPYDVVGRIDGELASAGITPEDVRHVVHTHLHADHAGGACMPDGRPRFPNAIHHVHPADWAFFAKSTDSADLQGRMAMSELEEEGMLDLGPDDGEVAAGVRMVHSPGHTPGHRSVMLTDGSATMLFAGDLLHMPIQVAHPDWPSSHDEDPVLGITSRVAALSRALDEGWSVAVSHFGVPFGAVARYGRRQRWISVRG
jgi:glyoxylase-like metal-dependent hydrolase (beta-lactamase superfamily II)